ncbi:proline--tRNA ligase [Buchnera aphidicola]|uniref:proline--tRNA ligase n=1 Tax=Buchnera aphidicola TaxID=9 RepID=UPI003463E34F
MRTSKYLLYTLKEIPHNANTISHQLMLRAGLIRKSASGLYIWLPNGIRIIKNIKKIIRKEMNRCGGIEICFPIMQTDKLWKKSNRLEQYGKELIKLYDRNQNCFILSPTHEEIITDFISTEIISYKKLPILLYQIQTKFRDEIRPRSGTIRSREFIMKDAYSFHHTNKSLEKTYQKIYKTYTTIFNKLNLKFYSVKAESGLIGGKCSHEFQAISNNGEDKIIIKDNQNHQKNNQINSYQPNAQKIKIFYIKKYIKINDYFKKKIINLQKMLFYIKDKIIKIFILKKHQNFIALFIRGDEQFHINQNSYLKKKQLNFANKIEILNNILKNKKNINLSIPLIMDINVAKMNETLPIVIINNEYFIEYNLNQNFTGAKIQNIKIQNDILKISNSIEIGHIFKIGKKYSKIMNAQVKNKNGTKDFIHMGCYGIGISRIVAAIIEQNHDQNGIIWPNQIAPFQVLIIPINLKKCQKIQNISEKLYKDFKEKKIEVLLEDRHERIGIIFSDANLIGIPNIIIINQQTINENIVEYQTRKERKKINIHIKNIIPYITKKIQNNI